MVFDPSHDSPYVQVRALSRGLHLLRALNQVGAATPRELSAATGLDRTTIYRLLETLAAEGYVAASPSSGHFRLTRKIRELSNGFTDRDAVSQIVAPELGQLLAKVLWPSDYAAFEGGAMIIRETTHPFSSFSVHRSVIGQPRSLVGTALGQAVLTAASPKLRHEMLAMAQASGVAEAADEALVDRLIAETRARGYAWRLGLPAEPVSAMALPIRYRSEPIGAINIIFYGSAIPSAEVAVKFLPDLRATADAIEEKLSRVILSA